jgi:Spirocyclase AveC-like
VGSIVVVKTAIEAGSRARRVTALNVAAALGILLACFQAYVLVKWVAGPNFQEVTYGPTIPPTWMKVAILTAEVLSTAMVVVLVYRFVVGPWRQERRIPFDGLLVLTALCVSMYDPLSSYFHIWFTYNSYFFNRGTAMVGVPGWQSFNEPGAQIAWPIFFIPALYAGMFLFIPMLGCYVMRRARSRWPQLPNLGLLAVCFMTIVVIDIVLEGVIVMRLGIYDHTGPSISFLDSYYSHNALANIVLVGVTITAVTALRFFRNDRGETLVERGSRHFGTTGSKVTALRFFAVFAAMQVCLLLGYHLPTAIWTTVTPTTAWHEDMQQNSYLNDHICGVATPRVCPQR